MLSPIRVFQIGLLAVLSPIALAQTPARVPLHLTRSSPSDLEIGGNLTGVPRGQTRFVRYADLLRLPQQNVTAVGDANFSSPIRIGGIPMERLPALLGASRDALMITALCDDNYKANYPAAYLQSHHPILVLRINGQPSSRWPKGVLGPYIVSHPSFTPSFKALSHTDEPQIPWGVIRLDFRRESDVYAPIQPFGPNANAPIVQQGFTIARQNCFRCHNSGTEGGTKANRPWDVVARRAATDPQYFDNYVRNPKRSNPASQMAASPTYDDATLAALRKYFQPFVEVRR